MTAQIEQPAPQLPQHRPDLDDTANCPLHHECAACWRSEAPLLVTAMLTPVGVICLTRCRRCFADGRLPRLSTERAAVLTLAHCEHLGMTLDEMVDRLAREM